MTFRLAVALKAFCAVVWLLYLLIGGTVMVCVYLRGF